MRRKVLPLLVFSFVLPVRGQAAETITYTYDALGRLVQVVRTGTVNNNTQVTYTLDAAGNRVTKVVTKP